jgi:hypothetical protein
MFKKKNVRETKKDAEPVVEPKKAAETKKAPDPIVVKVSTAKAPEAVCDCGKPVEAGSNQCWACAHRA